MVPGFALRKLMLFSGYCTPLQEKTKPANTLARPLGYNVVNDTQQRPVSYRLVYGISLPQLMHVLLGSDLPATCQDDDCEEETSAYPAVVSVPPPTDHTERNVPPPGYHEEPLRALPVVTRKVIRPPPGFDEMASSLLLVTEQVGHNNTAALVTPPQSDAAVRNVPPPPGFTAGFYPEEGIGSSPAVFSLPRSNSVARKVPPPPGFEAMYPGVVTEPLCISMPPIVRPSESINTEVNSLQPPQRRPLFEVDLSETLTPLGYSVGRKLGEGSFGSVYKGEHDGIPVAFKHIPYSNDKQMVADELRFLKMFKCHNQGGNGIIQHHDTIKGKSGTFIVLGFCAGMDLFDHVQKRGRFHDHKGFRSLAFFLFKALHTMHKQGVAHMDIKPENIMYDRREGASLIDLGLCVQMPSSGKINMVQGTEIYMAPEVRNVHEESDLSADIYSMGCTLFYLLTKRCLNEKGLEDPWKLIKNPATRKFLQRLTHTDPSQRPTAYDVMFDDWVMSF